MKKIELTHGCFVVAAVLFYFVSSISLTMFNKWLFASGFEENVKLDQNMTSSNHQFQSSSQGSSPYHFHFPLTVTCIHQVLVSLLVVVLERPVLLPIAGEISRSRELMRSIVPIGIICGLDWGLSNTSLRFITLSLYEMVKCSTPVVVMLIGFCFHLAVPSAKLVGIVVMISLGTFLAVSGGDLSAFGDPLFPRTGFLCVAVATGLSGLRLSLVQRVLQQMRVSDGGRSHGVNAVTTLYYSAPSSAAALVIPALLVEGSDVVRYVSEAPTHVLLEVSIWITATSAIAFLLSLSEFLVTRITSALTICVVGITKQMLIIGLAMVFFGDRLKMLNMAGSALAFLGIFLYKTVHLPHIARESDEDADISENIPVLVAKSRLSLPSDSAPVELEKKS